MKLVIIGASGHGKVAADIAGKCGYQDIVFLDDDASVKQCMGYPVVGGVADTGRYTDSEFFIAIGNPVIREKIQAELLDQEMHMVTLIHPGAVVADHVEIGTGTVIMAGTVINPDSRIGSGCIINTGATVDHDNVLEDYVHVAVGSHLAGNVHVGKGTWIGAGVTVSNDVRICGGCMIGAGAVVIKDIVETGTYIGVPAEKIKSGKRIEDTDLDEQ